ncbi:S-layer homology domain-containing protein [Paenibacillus borealis]|uniref:S-layer homology domain-containing protein n=1 Tax=Paenibacillus borealis TaxID=160799 RepID=UPI0006950DDF|nr:S-layer homology domain-containing protein [Paenibacillus borealis]
MSIRKSLLSKAFVIMISSILLAVTLIGDIALPTAKAEVSVPEPSDLVVIHETVRGGFTHPGVGVTKSVLENMREQVIAGQEPWNSYYAAMTKSSYASRTVTSTQASAADPAKPKSVAVNSKGAFVTDGLSAYTQALMYYITGDEVYRANAMAIIRIWEQMDPAQYTYFTDSHIHMGIPLNRMVTAAEILRYTGARNEALSWTEADTAKFTSNLIVPMTETFLHGNNYFMNQHLYPLLGAMSGYIFTDNIDRYKEGVEWFTVNRTAVDQGQNGAIRQLFRLVTEDAVTGEQLETPRVQHVEMGRDQAHGAGDLTNVEILGRLLDAQGTKVDPADGTLSTADNAVTAYAFLGNRILKAADYFAQYMLGYDTPWTPVVARYDAEGNPVIYKVLSGAYRGRIGGNVYGQYYYYKYSMGVDIEKEAPYYAEMFNKRTPYYWESPDGGADYWLFIPKEAASEGASTLPEVSPSADWTEIEQRATSLDTNAVTRQEGDISYVQVKATEAGSRISVVASSTSLKTVALRIRTNGTARLEVNGWTESELVLPDTKGQWKYITLTMDQYHGLGDLIYFKVTGPGTLVDIDHLLLAPAAGLTPPAFTSGPADVNAYAYTGSEATLQVDLSAKDAAAGDTVTYQLDHMPEGAVFNESTGAFSWKPEQPGVYSLIVSAADGVSVTAKAVTVTVGESRQEAATAAAGRYNPETSYISTTLAEYMAMIGDVMNALPDATDEEMYRKLAGLNLAAQGLKELTPLMKDGSLRYFDTIASSTFGTEIGNLIDNAPDSFAGYYLADSLSYILDFGESFKVSATAFALQVRTGFPERIGGAAVYGSNDKESWTRLTPGMTTVSDAMQTLEVGEAQQEGQFRFLKLQMIEPSSTMFELSELRIYGQRHETHNKLKSVTLSSPQSTQNRVETGSRVDLSFQSAEPIEGVEVTIQGRQASVHTTDRINWTASVIMDSAMPAGKIKFSINYTTAGGLPAAPALFTTDHSVLYYVNKSKYVDVTKLARVTASSAQYGSNGLPADKVGYLLFDGNTATYGDLASGNGAYYTLDFGPEASIRLSGVILLPRTGYASRMNGLIIQGSNDELNWTILTPAVSGAADQSWTYINEEQIKDSKPYRYLRIVNPGSWSGNVAEVEIYGEYSIPAAVLESKVKGPEGYTRLSYYQYKHEADRIVEAAGDQGADMLALLNELFQAERLLVTVTELPAERITVTESMVMASHISWDGKLSEAVNGWKAFDGDKATYTDTKANPGWIVADLGAGNDKALSSFKFYPRSTQAHLGRVNGAILQGSADGEHYTDLYTISGITTAEWHTAAISGDTAYRYLRYYSPSGNANVAELEFYQKTADRTLLEYLKEQAEGVRRDLYTEESLAALDTAKAAALDLAADAPQSSIDAAASGLHAALEHLAVKAVIVSLNKVEVTTVVGTAPELPSVVEAVYSDNTVRSLSVHWQDIDPVQYSSVGSFTVTGAVYGTGVPAIANVAVMDEDSPTPPVLPAPPTGLTASSITANSLRLGWNAPADNVRVAGYEVLLNGEVHGTVTGDTYEYGFTRLLPDTSYTFRVTAFDDSGNKASSTDYTVKTLKEEEQSPPAGGGSTGENAFPSAPQTVINVHGSRIQVIPAANQGAALATLSEESLEEALKQAIQNKEDTLHIQVQPSGELSAITLELPVSSWLKAQREGIRFLSVESGLASLLIPFDAVDSLKDTDRLTVSIGQADRSGWKASLSGLLKNKPVYEFGLSVNGQSVNVFAKGSVVKAEIPYTPQADESVYGLVAASLRDDGGLEVIRNSKYDRTAGRLVFGARHFSKYAVVSVPSGYNDMEPYSWAKDGVTALSAREIVKGTGNNSYAPGRAVSRAEFLKMMMEAFELVQSGHSSSFKDVKAGQWYADAVASAEALGIVTGYGGSTFGTDRSITREEMAVITVRILKAAGEELPKQHEAVKFSDTPLISAFALDAVNLMAEAGFIEGQTSGAFAPKSQATRAEAAVLVARVMGFI